MIINTISEIQAITYNPIGMFSREVCDYYWAEYVNKTNKVNLYNLTAKYA